MTDIQKLIESVQGYVRRCMEPFAARLKALEDRPAPKDGKSFTADEVQALVDAAVAKAVAALPPSKALSAEEVRDAVAAAIPKLETIKAMVDEAVSAIPRPANGQDADPEVIRSMVAEAFGAIPKPQDGKSITVDDLKPMLEQLQGGWALDFERRAQDVLQRAVDKMPVPKDGADAVPLDGFSAEMAEDGRTIVLRLTAGEVVKEARLRTATLLDRGFFQDGAAYEKGDTVTRGGSLWIAQKDAPTGKPGDGEADGWRLAVKRGRDGKDLMPEQPREPAGPVRLK
jgi:hypothetical protein